MAEQHVGQDAAQGTEDFHEPWCVDPDDHSVAKDRLGFVAVDSCGSDFVELEDREITERIVACVNFCAGLPTAYLQAHQVVALIDREVQR